MATNNSSNSSNGINSYLGGAFAKVGVSSSLTKRIAMAQEEIAQVKPLDNLMEKKLFAEVDETGIVGEDGQVTFNGKDSIVVYTDKKSLNLPWAIKYCSPTAKRDEKGRNQDGRTIVVNARETEAGAKAVLKALSLMRRNIFISVTEAEIVEQSKVIIDLGCKSHVHIQPVVFGGNTGKQMIQKGQTTIIVDGKEYSVRVNSNIDLQMAQNTGMRWVELDRVGLSTYHLTHLPVSDQAAIYDYVVYITATNADVWLKGLNKWEVCKSPRTIEADPKYVGFYDKTLKRVYEFAMYATKVIDTLKAKDAETASILFEAAVKESRANAVAKGVQNSIISGSVAESKEGVLHEASELYGMKIALDTVWAKSEQAQATVKSLGKAVVIAEDGTVTLDISKIHGELYLNVMNAETHQPVKLPGLKINTTDAAKKESFDPTSDTGKQNLRSLAVLNGADYFNFKATWRVTLYKPEAK